MLSQKIIRGTNSNWLIFSIVIVCLAVKGFAQKSDVVSTHLDIETNEKLAATMLDLGAKNQNHELLLDDFAYVLEWLSEKDVTLRKTSRDILAKQGRRVRKEIAKMPKMGLKFDDHIVPALIEIHSKNTGLSIKETRKLLKKRWEDYYRAKDPAVVENLAEQKSLVAEILRELSSSTSESCIARTKLAFHWFCLGSRGIRSVLAKDELLKEKQSIYDRLKIKEQSSKINVESRREAIEKILRSVREKPLTSLEKRLGVPRQEIPALYDLVRHQFFVAMLNGKKRSAQVASLPPFASDYANKKLLATMQKLEKSRDPLNREPLKSLKIRMHVHDNFKGKLEITKEIKELYSNMTDPYVYPLIPNGESILDESEFFRLSNPSYREFALKDLAPFNHGWHRSLFESFGMELTDDQYRQMLLLACDITNQLRVVTSIKKIAELNNQWHSELAEILLPKQSLIFFHLTFGTTGIVTHLTRPDVMKDLGIDEFQAEKIKAMGKKCATEFERRIENFRVSAIQNLLNELTPEVKRRLQEKLGFETKKVGEILGSSKYSFRFLSYFDPKTRFTRYEDMRRMRATRDRRSTDMSELYSGALATKHFYDILKVEYTDGFKKTLECFGLYERPGKPKKETGEFDD